MSGENDIPLIDLTLILQADHPKMAALYGSVAAPPPVLPPTKPDIADLSNAASAPDTPDIDMPKITRPWPVDTSENPNPLASTASSGPPTDLYGNLIYPVGEAF